MKDETRIRGAAGRKVLADPRTHRYYLCLNDSENEKFLTMFEQSGMKNKAEDRKSTRLNSSHLARSRMPSSA